MSPCFVRNADVLVNSCTYVKLCLIFYVFLIVFVLFFS